MFADAADAAPVEAAECEGPPRLLDRLQVDPERREDAARPGAALEATVRVAQRAPPDERAGDGDAEPAGEVVVAGARLRQRGRGVRRAQRPDGAARCDRGERLDGVGDLVAREAEVAMPAAALHGQHASFDEAGEMPARRRPADRRTPRELRGRKRAATAERADDRRARGIAEKSRDRSDFDVAFHGRRLTRRWFGDDRIVDVSPALGPPPRSVRRLVPGLQLLA